jgi:hypothetical protein
MPVERDTVEREALLRQGASPAEAAAILAAVSRFISDTASSTPTTPTRAEEPWLRAARLEAIGRWPAAAPYWGVHAPLQ